MKCFSSVIYVASHIKYVHTLVSLDYYHNGITYDQVSSVTILQKLEIPAINAYVDVGSICYGKTIEFYYISHTWPGINLVTV